MNAGRLRHQVTIQQQTQTATAYGGYSETWTDVATVWAHIKPLYGRERWHGDQVESDVTHQITIRYRSDVTVSPQMRVLYGSRVFKIISVINPEERNELLVLECVEENV